MGRGSVSPGFLLLCCSKEYENEKHEEQWMCFLAVSYGDTADTVHIILISLTPVIKIALEVEPCSISVRVYYDPYKIYFNISVRF